VLERLEDIRAEFSISEASIETDFEEAKAVVASAHLETEHLHLAERLFVARNAENCIIGCAAIERRGSRVYLQSLSVDRRYRRKGIGSRLVQATFDVLKEGDIFVALTLFWNNPFYRGLGFSMVNAKEAKAKDDIGTRDKHKSCTAWEMVKTN
jgi:N-acetylglutamate synthase-like GNAT family acetyltransferase